MSGDLGGHQSTLAKLELAERTLARTWLFLERGDGSLVADMDGSAADVAVAMRVVEAQEAERARLAQEIHDGPAQALTNAIFQADYVERVGETDPAAMLAELRTLRDLLRRELANVRGFIIQLRPPLLDELGLEGAIEEAVGPRAVAHRPRDHDRPARHRPTCSMTDQRTVALRIAQEALQNVRKHAAASTVVVARSGRTMTGSSRSATMVADSMSARWPRVAAGTSDCSSCASERS